MRTHEGILSLTSVQTKCDAKAGSRVSASSSLVRRSMAAALVTLLVAVLLSACAQTPSVGTPRSVNGGTEIVVPALWASPSSGASGIEPATVWVTTERTSDQLAYEVNLSDIEAKGGGAMWQAATSSAAAIGTLFSGFNPDNIGYRFDITGPIDGPSAGAILTIGVLAALNNQPLDSKTTMTGTISPDGSIGPVGLIPLKLKAAADAGYTRTLIPAVLTSVPDPETGELLDTQAYAEQLGVEVTFVQSLAEAYLAFTGENLFTAEETTPFVFSEFPALDASREEAATELQQAVQRSLDSSPEAPEAVRERLTAAVTASSEGDPSTGFALAVDALDQLADWQGSTRFLDDVEQQGSIVARDRFAGMLSENLTRIDGLIDRTVADAQLLSPAEQLALPGALGWLTYAQAVLESMQTQLSDSSVKLEDETLAGYAGLAQQVMSEAEQVFPQAMLVLRATPDSGERAAQPVNEFLSGYTNFLVAAGDANLGYLRSGLKLSEEEQSRYSVLELVPVVAQLGETASAIEPSIEDLGNELGESSLAMTYFVASTSLVTSFELFGDPDMWLSANQDSDSRNTYLENTVVESDELVHGVADQLIAEDLNPGFAVWSADWGSAAYAELSAQDQTARGASLALNELWYDVITVLSMNAFLGGE